MSPRKKKDEDDEEYFAIYIDDPDDDDDGDGMPEGCAACGGPWPSCQTSCSMYDDDD